MASDIRYRLLDPNARATTIAAIVATVHAHGSISKAAESFGINVRTLRRLLAEDPELRQAVDAVNPQLGRTPQQ